MMLPAEILYQERLKTLNAADYGDLFSARSDAGISSNGHGGLS